MEFLDFAEEVRFALELFIAVNIFSSIFSNKKDDFSWKVVIEQAVLVGVACILPFIRTYCLDFKNHPWLSTSINTAWYILLSLLVGIFIFYSYQLGIADTIFLTVAGYCLQHIEYIGINEVLAKGVWKKMESMPVIYIEICAFTTFLLYFVAYRFCRSQRKMGGEISLPDNRETITLGCIMYLVLMCATFMCQSIFVSNRRDYEQINYLGAIVDFLMCIVILGIQYAIMTISSLSREKQIVEQLLYERKRQYELSRENIETINHKCHDLKHQIAAISSVSESERKAYIEEINKSIDIYDSVLNTGNEVVDTILSEKSLNCERRQIRLSCIVDASHLDFMSTLDIYAILGNALDNAIENVSRYVDPEKRVISLSIKAVGDFLSIQTVNYCEEELEFRKGLPVTSKKNRDYHGFGMKSMQHLAEKYGGSLVCSAKDNMFTLQILLPMPKEFLRLYAMKQEEVFDTDASEASN